MMMMVVDDGRARELGGMGLMARSMGLATLRALTDVDREITPGLPRPHAGIPSTMFYQSAQLCLSRAGQQPEAARTCHSSNATGTNHQSRALSPGP